MTVTYTPKNKNIRGSDLTGSDGTVNRTYTVPDSNLIADSLSIDINGTHLHYGADYSVSGLIVTFLNFVDDTDYINVSYWISSTATTASTGGGYCTTLEVMSYSGIGINIIDENVGTGTGSAASFDLDNNNVIADSYSLYHAASGSNDMTALVETTHYALDKDSGRILLTASGMAALGTDILYATYVYNETFSDTILSSFITSADIEVDKMTGRNWGTPELASDYYSGLATSRYPTTDRPYQYDWDKPDFMVLKHSPVTKIDVVCFLNNPQPISKFYNYDAGTDAYTDYTDNVNFSSQAPFTLFDSSPATNDIVYIGSPFPFLGIDINLSTNGVGTSTIDWEYYNGSSWVDITETEVDDGSSTFEASGKFTWSYPYGWTATSVNGYSAYWIRGKLTDGYTTDPVCGVITIRDSINQLLEPRQYIFQSNGILSFNEVYIPNGAQNIRVDYYHGLSSTPALISELSALLSSVKCLINLSGGSYDDATSYRIGSKEISIGEVYVNIREVIAQYKKRIQEILDLYGQRADVTVI